MTFRTMLAIVPALALLLAIGRGFGMQGVLQDELFRLFPAQHTAISYAMNFVESYLNQTSGGRIPRRRHCRTTLDFNLAAEQRRRLLQSYLGRKNRPKHLAQSHRLHRIAANTPRSDALRERHISDAKLNTARNIRLRIHDSCDKPHPRRHTDTHDNSLLHRSLYAHTEH